MSWCNASEEGDGEPEFYESCLRTARKEHRCTECGGPIARGEQYELASGKWDGQIVTYKTCLKCENIRDHFCPDGWGHGRLNAALQATINRSLGQIRDIWIMPGKDRTIAMLVELVCELLEKQETREEAV